MAYLFQVEDRKVVPNTETLLISPFKEIWERDKSKKKDKAIREFAYIEFMSSARKNNPYKGYSLDVREIKIKEDIIKETKWEPDSLVEEAMRKIEEFQEDASSTYSYWKATKIGAEKMKDFFTELDLNATNDKGQLLYKPGEITRALRDTNGIITELDKLEKKVEEELFEAGKVKAGKEVSPFANP